MKKNNIRLIHLKSKTLYLLVFTILLSCNNAAESDIATKQKSADAYKCNYLKKKQAAKIENIKLAQQAIDENNDTLFAGASTWFFNYSDNPTDFLYFANRMAITNQSKIAFYDYVYFQDRYKQISPQDSLFINHLYWYLAKAKELGLEIDLKKFRNKEIFSKEIMPSEYYKSKF